MKRFLKPVYLPLMVLFLGVVTCLLRFWLFDLGTDDRGLLNAGSAPDVLSWVMVALAMALIALGSRSPEMDALTLRAPRSALGLVLAAVCFVVSGISQLTSAADILQTACGVFAFVAAAALLLLAWCRYIGSRSHILMHTALCLFLILCLVSRYRVWSSYSQLQCYAFELLTVAFTMLAGYHRAAFDVDLGKRKAYNFFSLGALFFALSAIAGSQDPVFFLGCALWMIATPAGLLPADTEAPAKEEEAAEAEQAEE